MADGFDDDEDVSLPRVVNRRESKRPEPLPYDVNSKGDPRIIPIVKPPRARKSIAPSSTLLDQVDACRDRAKQWDSASQDAESTLFEVLELAATIHERCEQSPELRDALRQRMSENGIRVTKATKNACLPLIKCVFTGLNEPRSNLSRYASAVRGYCQSGFSGFRQFIDKEGGLVAAAKNDRRANTSPRSPARPVDHQTRMDELMKNSRQFSFPVIGELARGQDAVVVLLGRRGEEWCLLLGGVASEADLRYFEKMNGRHGGVSGELQPSTLEQ